MPKTSGHLEDFLNFIQQTESSYEIEYANVGKADKETNDILHSMELDDMDYKERARLATRLKKVRQERRAAKNVCEALQPVIDFMSYAGNRAVIHKLRETLGAVRKVEKYHANRQYKKRVEI